MYSFPSDRFEIQWSLSFKDLVISEHSPKFRNNDVRNYVPFFNYVRKERGTGLSGPPARSRRGDSKRTDPTEIVFEA